MASVGAVKAWRDNPGSDVRVITAAVAIKPGRRFRTMGDAMAAKEPKGKQYSKAFLANRMDDVGDFWWPALLATNKDDPEREEIDAEWQAEVRDRVLFKMLSLLDEWEIERNDSNRWYRLATALAYEHVKSFGGPFDARRRGPKNKWTDMTAADFVITVHLARETISADRGVELSTVSTTDALKALWEEGKINKAILPKGARGQAAIKSLLNRHAEATAKGRDVLFALSHRSEFFQRVFRDGAGMKPARKRL